MYKIIILGSGAAPGVPSLTGGWGACDSNNYKNRRSRTSVYLQYNDTKILIDTSPDLRNQLLDGNICRLDAVLYTHSHADHLHGIDDLREINRAGQNHINFYGNKETVNTIKERFPYLVVSPNHKSDALKKPSLVANKIEYYNSIMINDLKITPIRLIGHAKPSTGYIFNDGDIVYIADYRHIEDRAFDYVKKPIKLMILPLTAPEQSEFHAGLDDVLSDIERFKPQRAILNHLAIECDYDEIDKLTPDNVEPAYDNMTIVLED